MASSCRAGAFASPNNVHLKGREQDRIIAVGRDLRLVIQTLPQYYPIAPTHRIISLNVEATVRCLADCFRLLSIQARAARDGSLWLLTPTQTELQFSVWQLEQDGTVCVEVSRICGDTMDFHRYARPILDAAEGIFSSADYENHKNGPAHGFNSRLLATTMPKGALFGPPHNPTEPLEIAESMLDNDLLDSQMLGLEMLAILTDGNKSTPETCQLASSAVLHNDKATPYKRANKIANTICQLIHKKKSGPEETDYDSDDEDFEGSIRHNYHRTKEQKATSLLALTILSNALEVAAATKNRIDIDAIRRNSVEQTGADVFQYIRSELLGCGADLNLVCLGIKCLRLACEVDEGFGEELRSPGMTWLVNQARETGRLSHWNLESESCRFLETLNATQ